MLGVSQLDRPVAPFPGASASMPVALFPEHSDGKLEAMILLVADMRAEGEVALADRDCLEGLLKEHGIARRGHSDLLHRAASGVHREEQRVGRFEVIEAGLEL